ncbi:MAG: hypothetical protein AB8F95_01765 [Bacteroidia bacterium]
MQSWKKIKQQKKEAEARARAKSAAKEKAREKRRTIGNIIIFVLFGSFVAYMSYQISVYDDTHEEVMGILRGNGKIATGTVKKVTRYHEGYRDVLYTYQVGNLLYRRTDEFRMVNNYRYFSSGDTCYVLYDTITPKVGILITPENEKQFYQALELEIVW